MASRYEEHGERSDDHDARNREAIGRRQRARRAEGQHQQDAAAEQGPVDEGNIDLAGVIGVGVQQGDARKQAEPDRLHCQGKGPGNKGLRGDDGRKGRQDDHGVKRPAGRQAVEKHAAGGFAAAQEIGALAQVIQQQRGEDQPEPAQPDRAGAEMAEVGVHGLAAGDDQHDRAENRQQAQAAGMGEESQAASGIESRRDLGMRDDLSRAQGADDEKPQREDRPENAAYAGRAARLQREKPGQQDQGDRNDGAAEIGRRRLQALHRRQHADCGGDHAVAQQQAGAEHQRPQHEAGGAMGAVVKQAIEREHAALALVLRAQHQGCVFDSDDQGQRPDHQRHAAQHVLGRARQFGLEDLVHGVERRRPDVAIDHTQRPKRQRRQFSARRMAVMLAVVLASVLAAVLAAVLAPRRMTLRPGEQIHRASPRSANRIMALLKAKQNGGKPRMKSGTKDQPDTSFAP